MAAKKPKSTKASASGGKTKRQERKEARDRKRKERMGKYRSVFERNIADDMASRGIWFEYEPHYLYFWKRMPGQVCLHCGSQDTAKETPYLPDFRLANGIYVEAKGRFTSQDRTKMLAVKRDNPDLDLRMLFLQDNWLTHNKKQRYSDWCEKNGFPWAMNVIPKSWVLDYW